MKQEKSKIRSEMRQSLVALTQEQIAEKSEKICAHLKELSTDDSMFSRADVLAVFCALGCEPDLSSLHLLFPGKKFLYPLSHPDKTLSFHLLASPSELVKGRFGVCEPVPQKHKMVPLHEIDLFLCPGLAFGLDGSRLGKGEGYYDRTLENVKAPRWAIGFENQILPTLPHDERDVKMQAVLTENGLRAL